MSTENDKYTNVEGGREESRHSALEELSRDERRPAVILLSALLLAAIFFAFGIMIGRWTAQTEFRSSNVSVSSTQTPPTSNVTTTPQQQHASATTNTNKTPAASHDREKRYSLLIENLASSEAAQSLIKSLERAGYKDVRQRAAASASKFNILVGRYTRDEAETEATKLRGRGGPRLKNVRVIEATDG